MWLGWGKSCQQWRWVVTLLENEIELLSELARTVANEAPEGPANHMPIAC